MRGFTIMIRSFATLFLQNSSRNALHGRTKPSFRFLTTTSLQSTTVKEALASTIQAFESSNVIEPLDSAVHLLSKAIELDYETGFRDLRQVHNDEVSRLNLSTRVLTPQEEDRLQEYIERRIKHEPIQYIVGQWDFLDHTFYIEPPLLCPRPETEELVLLVEDFVRQTVSSDSIRILDIGAGTGCIGLSLASRIPNAKVEAIDIEPKAIQIAEQNAARVLGEKWANQYTIILQSIEDYTTDQPLDLVVSNPPYIPEQDMASLDETVKGYESHHALCGGAKGLDVIDVIIEKLPTLLKEGCACWMEVDPSHPKSLEEQLMSGPVQFTRTHNDMFGRERFVQLKNLKGR